jgi:hypothetical protein
LFFTDDICDFVQKTIRAFCDDESIIAFEALLREVSQDANVVYVPLLLLFKLFGGGGGGGL